jgi:hypothetical protein
MEETAVTMLIRRFTSFILAILLTACQSGTPTSTSLPATPTELPPPTVTASPSPTALPPTLTPTPPPAPSIFTEQFDGALPYWTFQQIDIGQPEVTPTPVSGFLKFDLTAPNQWVYALYDVQAYADIRVDAQVEDLAGQAGAVGIVCRYSQDQGWYEFNVYADQTYELLYGKWLAPGLPRYTPLFQGISEKIKPDANEIGLVCQGNTLTPFINGTQMRIWQDNKFGLVNGKIGISAASFADVPFTTAYDWVKVSLP